MSCAAVWEEEWLGRVQSRGCCTTDARDDAWDSIGRHRGQMHGQHMHVSSPSRGVGRIPAPLPMRCMLECSCVHLILMWSCVAVG